MKKKILIVEDNPLNMRLIEMILRAKGYILLKATDGEEAVNMVEGERPDLIIMDVRLPEMSGLEVTRCLKENPVLNNVPIIALTAYAMKGDRDKVIEAGCDAYLSKPVDTRELPKKVAEMLLREKDDA